MLLLIKTRLGTPITGNDYFKPPVKIWEIPACQGQRTYKRIPNKRGIVPPQLP